MMTKFCLKMYNYLNVIFKSLNLKNNIIFQGASRDQSHVQQEADELRRFLVEKTTEYEPMVMMSSFTSKIPQIC